MRLPEKVCGASYGNNKLVAPLSVLSEGCLIYRLCFMSAKLFLTVLEKPSVWQLRSPRFWSLSSGCVVQIADEARMRGEA